VFSERIGTLEIWHLALGIWHFFPPEGPPLAKKSTSKAVKDDARKFAIEVARVAADDRNENIVILDLRGRSPVTDFFVISTGASDRQRLSVAEDAAKLAREVGRVVLGISGSEQPDWVLVDFVDVVLHVFDAQTRGFYDLEMLWGDAPHVRWQRRATAKAPADPAEKN
jgi:ribosome-associated protein